MKKDVTLRFSSSESLWMFWKETSFTPCRVSFSSKTINLKLTEEEINVAIKKFKAETLNEIGNRAS